MIKKYAVFILLFSSLAIEMHISNACDTQEQELEVTKASKSFLVGIIYNVFSTRQVGKFIRYKKTIKILQETIIDAYSYNTFPKSEAEAVVAKKDQTPAACAYDIFSSIDILNAFKKQKATETDLIRYFAIDPLNIFPALSDIARRVVKNDTPKQLMLPRIFFDYAQHSEFQLFYMTNIIAQHLENPESIYHDYFHAIRKICISRNYGTIAQARAKYPSSPLILPDEAEQHKIIDQILSGKIKEMISLIKEMPLNDWNSRLEGNKCLIECRRKYKEICSNLSSVSQSTSANSEGK